MKVSCNRKAFLSALSSVSGVCPARSPKPILSNIRFSFDHDGVATLSATDLELGVVHRVLGVNAELQGSAGSAILPPAKLAEMFARAPDIEMVIDTGDGTSAEMIHVRGASAKYKLPSEDPSLFPTVPEWSAGSWWTVKAGDLKRAIRRTSYATDREGSARYALSGALFETTEDNLSLIATDGRRLAKATIQCEAVNDPAQAGGSPVVPLKALKLIDKIIGDGDDERSVDFAWVAASGRVTEGGAPNAIILRMGDESTTIYSRLVEGRFPRYQDVFPSEVTTRIVLDVATLRQVVQQATITTSEESRATDFRFAAGKLSLESTAADVGSAEVEMMIDHEGAAVDVAFDGRYLIEMLGTIGDEEALTVGLIDGKNAVTFDVEGLISVIMPLTRER